ncbi:hypothetical protein CC78DRAFT_172029 [Lojkania enalia]|uniref:SUN domain-containing protein n=1 Tax=Lojkania enalia TaxID=147567 RepID=A0A9P4N8N4_9PLEO|nr:hypothetical protein CC78DRAFT_172029 [Didymosphaeria enalia]
MANNRGTMEPTPRRSTRISSRAGSMAGSVAPPASQSIAVTSATPSRAAARGKGVLPKVKARQSHAYGSAGRLGAAEEIHVTDTGFTSAFEAQRSTAIARDHDRPPLFTLEDFNSAHSAMDGEADDDTHTSRDSRASPTPSHLNTSKSFGLDHEAGMAHTRRAAAVPQSPPIVPRHRWSFVFLLGALALGLLPAFFLRTTNSAGAHVSYRHKVFDAVAARADYTWNNFIEWIKPPETQEERFDKLPDDTEDFMFNRQTKQEQRIRVIEKSIESFSQYLPRQIAVIRNDKGNLEIPDEFWRALVSKLHSEGLNDPTFTRNTEWIDFFNKNQVQIEELVRRAIDAHAPKPSEVLLRAEFIELMNKEYEKLRDRVDKHVRDTAKSLFKEAKDTARQEASKAFMDQLRIESLALTNIIANSEVHLKKINFFAPGLGAYVDPYRTSTTVMKKSSMWSRILNNVFLFRYHRPPITALNHWDEPGQCWCTASSKSYPGVAQISVGLGHTIYPKQITVEHLPKEAALRIESAPKEIELWVDASHADPDVISSLTTIPECSDGPKGWLCLGKFAYNIASPNHVQTFNLDVDITGLFGVSKAMVRVMTNWGEDHTCLYRLRLHGEAI